ncbi:uncharacterized protein LOC123956412 isoform X4 [Micropterus dolomieu]|uniref:uncharacterized protein LOC123956412 isoform X4 n=1 Tax=Micropterus dolomieu TaxID=147949 RepID=UPI001E8CCDF9|nr:uncharacterized protein LOC123956412 isoform X4 [Micropterus dolomieu]
MLLFKSDSLKDKFAPLDLPEDLDVHIALAIKIDKRLEERERESAWSRSSPPDHRRLPVAAVLPPTRSLPPPPSPSSAMSGAAEEPMEFGRARLTPEERQKRIRESGAGGFGCRCQFNGCHPRQRAGFFASVYSPGSHCSRQLASLAELQAMKEYIDCLGCGNNPTLLVSCRGRIFLH